MFSVAPTAAPGGAQLKRSLRGSVVVSGIRARPFSLRLASRGRGILREVGGPCYCSAQISFALSAENVVMTKRVFLMWLIASAGISAQHEAVVLDPGNVIHFSFPTSNIPFQPPGWGEECGIVFVGPEHGGAFWNLTLAAPSTGGFVTEFDFILAESHLEDTKEVTLAINKADGHVGSALRNWRIYLHRVEDSLWFILVLGEETGQTIWTFKDVQVGTVYAHKVEYNILDQLIRWSVNGQEVNSETMAPQRPQNVASIVIGSSRSSSGRNVVYLLDKIRWLEIRED